MTFLRLALTFLVSMVAMVIYLFWTERFLPVLPSTPWLTSIPVLLVTLYLIVVLHEIGHVMAGAARGFKFMAFQAGPLNIEPGRVSLRAKRNGVNGQVLMLPPPQARATDWVVFFLGGILANAGTVPLAGWAAWHTHGLAATFFSLLAQLSFLVSVLNVLPLHGGLTDGARIRALLPHAPNREVTAATLSLQNHMLRCVSPPEWPAGAVQTLRRGVHHQPLMGLAAASLLSCVDDWDEVNEKALRDDLQRLQNLVTSIHKLPKVYGQMWHASMGGIKASLGDVEGARHEYALANQREMQSVAPLSLAAFRCGILYSEGNHQQARAAAEAALATIPLQASERFTAFSLQHFLEKTAGGQDLHTTPLNPQ